MGKALVVRLEQGFISRDDPVKTAVGQRLARRFGKRADTKLPAGLAESPGNQQSDPESHAANERDLLEIQKKNAVCTVDAGLQGLQERFRVGTLNGAVEHADQDPFVSLPVEADGHGVFLEAGVMFVFGGLRGHLPVGIRSSLGSYWYRQRCLSFPFRRLAPLRLGHVLYVSPACLPSFNCRRTGLTKLTTGNISGRETVANRTGPDRCFSNRTASQTAPLPCRRQRPATTPGCKRSWPKRCPPPADRDKAVR